MRAGNSGCPHPENLGGLSVIYQKRGRSTAGQRRAVRRKPPGYTTGITRRLTPLGSPVPHFQEGSMVRTKLRTMVPIVLVAFAALTPPLSAQDAEAIKALQAEIKDLA